ncbi:MAG TPA: CDP-alcohol phosphatidyltransferase family protein [Candidatus Pelethocola excrementipullorum]|nr:CDP-alcohol phosphatidyltransferase family protein [Candidatus Pelethocola excrementipullorum]
MKITKKELLTIPNLMGYFRLLLIPVFLYLYCTAKSNRDYYLAAFVIVISGITDFLDGYVARKFNQVTEFGKALDPIADKLTQGALVLALSTRYPLMIALVVLFVIKEGFMLVMGIVFLRKGKRLDGAMWFGKVCTAILYVVMFVLILFPQLPALLVNVLILICGAAMLLALVLYVPVFYRMGKSI